MDGLVAKDASNGFLWPATEVKSERVMGKPSSTIPWDSQASPAGPAVTYDVVCGTFPLVGGFFSDAFCVGPNTLSTSIIDSAIPTAGRGLYFLERAGTGAGCVGTYGSGFNPATSRDPALAATCP